MIHQREYSFATYVKILHFCFCISAKLETLESEEAAIIKKFNSTTDINKLDNEAFKYRKANEKSHKTSLDYNAYWQTINPALMERLKQLYAVDTIMFGYPHDPFAD